MSEPTAIDGSKGPLIVRRIVVWRRLEPGDVRTPGTELAPESTHLEAKILEVGIARELHEDLERLEAKRAEVTAIARGWITRYEPAGVLFATGGALAVGVWLDYLPDLVLPLSGSLVVLGVALGVMTRAFKLKRDNHAESQWRATEERDELAKIERRLTPRWERFAARLREDTGFRADVRVGDIHEAERLVSIDPARVAHPDTWRPDPKPNDVRYGWMYADGRVVEQRAELEDTDDAPTAASDADEQRGAPRASDRERAEEDEEDDEDDSEEDEPSEDEDEPSEDESESEEDELEEPDRAATKPRRAR